jgi:FG-GAP repeat
MKTRTSALHLHSWLRLLQFTVVALGISFLQSARAEPWMPKYDAFIGANGSQLGASIAVRTSYTNGTRQITHVFVGAPNATKDGLAEAGSVYVYKPGPQGWQLATTLYANVPTAGAHFGAALADVNGQIAIGIPDSPFGGSNAGRVEFYSEVVAASVWVLGAQINGATGQRLGRALAADSDMLAIGYAGSFDRGCVSTYQWNPVVPHLRPLPVIDNSVCGVDGAVLGSSLAIRRTGNSSFLLVAGAPGESQNGNALAGAAHVYVPNSDVGTGGLIEVGTLAAPNPGFLDVFGTSVGIDANYVYVGATGRDNGVGRVGSVAIFEPALLIGYQLLDEYFPAQADIGGHCGASLMVDSFNDQFIFGCPDSDGVFTDDGEAHVFRETTFLGQPVWTESLLTAGLLSSGPDHLGSSVAILGNQAFVGARTLNAVGPNTNNGGWWEFGPEGSDFADGFE